MKHFSLYSHFRITVLGSSGASSITVAYGSSPQALRDMRVLAPLLAFLFGSVMTLQGCGGCDEDGYAECVEENMTDAEKSCDCVEDNGCEDDDAVKAVYDLCKEAGFA